MKDPNVEARCSPTYAIGDDDLQELGTSIVWPRNLVETLCTERLAAFENDIGPA